MANDDPLTPTGAGFTAALAKWNAVRRPGPAHQLLERLAGEWSVTIRFQGGDTPYESRGRSSARLVHGGRFLIDDLHGEIQAPDANGRMRPEPYTATRILGVDLYRNVWSGVFVENQNTHLLSFTGPVLPGSAETGITMFGGCDEPMLDLRDTTMKYVLRVGGPDRYAWEVFALAVDGRKVVDFLYAR